ncbi:hypothetical protein, partial [Brucella tritici]|uniref:hypothetical protein n=1 Tax=Brucella tritici TaxID=94626 RepID=UPI001AEDCB85
RVGAAAAVAMNEMLIFSTQSKHGNSQLARLLKTASGLNLTFESRLNEMLFQTSNLKNPIDTEEEIRSLL